MSKFGKKIKQKARYYIKVLYSDQPKAKKVYSFAYRNEQKEMANLENQYLVKKSNWLYAFMYCNNTDTVLHCYNPKTGIKRLSESEYQGSLKKNQTKIKGYAVPSFRLRRKGIRKGKSIPASSIEDLMNNPICSNRDYERIFVYVNEVKSHVIVDNEIFDI